VVVVAAVGEEAEARCHPEYRHLVVHPRRPTAGEEVGVEEVARSALSLFQRSALPVPGGPQVTKMAMGVR
jgi:hypothetical protein